MNRTPVESSNIRAVGYEPRTLEVEFRNGSVYAYSDVPDSVHQELMQAESKGKFLNAKIKKSYPYRRV